MARVVIKLVAQGYQIVWGDNQALLQVAVALSFVVVHGRFDEFGLETVVEIAEVW